MLEVRRLRIFAAVAERGSCTAAAEELFMTHSAVSQQMALLERQWGVPLMVRGPRGVELTESGKVLAERSTVLRGAIPGNERELRDLKAKHALVRLGAFPTAGADLIRRVVREYQKRFADIRIVSRPALAGESEVEFAALSGENRVVRGHRTPHDDAFTVVCRLAGYEPNVDYPSAQGMVAARIGISTAPKLSLVAQHPDVVAVPIAAPAPHRGIAAVRLRSANHPPAAQQMLDVLRDATVSADSTRAA